MKMSFAQLCFAVALVALPTCTLTAQSSDVVGGTLRVTFDSKLPALLQGQGIAIRSSSGRFPSTGFTFVTQGGSLDQPTGTGTIPSQGTIAFTSGQTELRLERLTLDTTGPSPTISAYIYVNQHIVDKLPVFMILSPNPLGAPIKSNTGLYQGIRMIPAPSFTQLFDGVFKTDVLKANTGVSMLQLMLQTSPNQSMSCFVSSSLGRRCASQNDSDERQDDHQDRLHGHDHDDRD